MLDIKTLCNYKLHVHRYLSHWAILLLEIPHPLEVQNTIILFHFLVHQGQHTLTNLNDASVSDSAMGLIFICSHWAVWCGTDLFIFLMPLQTALSGSVLYIRRDKQWSNCLARLQGLVNLQYYSAVCATMLLCACKSGLARREEQTTVRM